MQALQRDAVAVLQDCNLCLPDPESDARGLSIVQVNAKAYLLHGGQSVLPAVTVLLSRPAARVCITYSGLCALLDSELVHRWTC